MHSAHHGRRNTTPIRVLLGLLIMLALPASTPGAIIRTASANGTLNTTTSPSKTNVAIGETITVTVLLKNDTTDRCYGVPQFRLYIQTAPGVNQDTTNPIFMPAQPITLYTSVGPGQSTSATFTVTAARAGSVTFSTTVSVEGTGPGCQPPYFWTNAAPSRSAVVTVGTGQPTYLPVVGKVK